MPHYSLIGLLKTQNQQKGRILRIKSQYSRLLIQEIQVKNQINEQFRPFYLTNYCDGRTYFGNRINSAEVFETHLLIEYIAAQNIYSLYFLISS